MSSRPGSQLTTDGADWQRPPSDSHPPQFAPSHQRWYSAWSVPIANVSRRFGAQATVTGADSTIPPSDCQPCQSSIPSGRGNALSVPTIPDFAAGGHWRSTNALKSAYAVVLPVNRWYVAARVGCPLPALTIFAQENPSW